ncbi:MAG: phosphatidylserine decarboxylase [Candidatus Omnitrophica bacterium CG1_02_46_14]|nr:MAG: phosphatidylserine decarboxylase [Candidatus Omnitrophica bacterium CG1_02_46_14]
MSIAKESHSFILVCLVSALVTFKISIWASVCFILTGILVACFFRDPKRTIVTSEKAVLSPADGRVIQIDPVASEGCQDKPWTRVWIFLSILDVHINRSPIAGQIENIKYTPGKFLLACKKEALASNENNLIHIRGKYFSIRVRQIAGKLARKIVCYCGKGDRLVQGQKFGLIQFGSGVQVDMPSSVKIQAAVGQRVKGGVTILGIFEP